MSNQLKERYGKGRDVSIADQGNDNLGNLKHLPGAWINSKDGEETGFEGRGWNMTVLPFENPAGGRGDFRVLVNQYNETLQFDTVDGPVPNRGIDQSTNTNTDQEIFALDYQQGIKQIAVGDSPETDASIQGPVGGTIHHEPGFFLNILNEQTDSLDIARLATIPHGDSVLAMGKSRTFNGPPTVEPINGLPIGATQDLSSPYLAPYAAFSGDNAFKGVVPEPFPGFDVAEPHKLLQLGIDGLDVKKTTELHLDTKLQTGGIVNIPFVVKQANATEMTSTFYIMELNGKDEPKFALSYAQTVMLEFFPRFDSTPGLIKWPHVSINTMVFDGKPKPEMSFRMPPA